MKILIFSWRDIKHPYGGGAELLSHEMAKRWVKSGHSVTHFSACFPDAKENEVIDGVTYLRRGTWYNVHILAFLNCLRGDFKDFDVIVDEVHGYPFFSALYSKKPVVCLACEVAKEVWDQMYPFPINLIGKIVERLYLLLYRRVTFLTISESTKKDLVVNGIADKNITVIPMGFTYSLPKDIPEKSSLPTVIFLGRLAQSKGIEDAIKAFSIIKSKINNAKMWIVGRGEESYERRLRNLVRKLRLDKDIDFKGFVSQKKKFDLLVKAHLILVPSVREGWGLIVPEANIVGTPAIVYNVPGLRDVTKNGVNGIIVKRTTPADLAKESLRILKNKKLYQMFSSSAKRYARSMNWDDSATVALGIIKK